MQSVQGGRARDLLPRGCVAALQRPASIETSEQAAVRINHLLDRLSKPFAPHPITLSSLAIERDVDTPCLGVDLPGVLMHAQGIAKPLEHVVTVNDQTDACVRAHSLHLETQLHVEPAALGFQVEQRRVGEEARVPGVDELGVLMELPKKGSGASNLGNEPEAVGVSLHGCQSCCGIDG